MANEEEEKKKPNIVSGILNDLAMGLGLRERDQDYYERTARTIGRNQGSGQAAGRYYDRMAAQNFPKYGGPLAFIGSGAGPRDFFDGGGLGRSGDRFVGGPYSMLANALGIRPMGYQQRAIDAAVASASRSVGSMPQAPATPAPAAAEEPLRGTAGTFTAAYEMPLTAMSQAPSELTSPMSNVPLQPAGPAVTGSGKYPQYLYDQGYSDMFLDSLPEQDLEFLYSFNPAGR